MLTGWVWLRRWWRAAQQAGVLLVTVPLILLATTAPAGAAAAAAASSHPAPDQAPGEVALLGVCGAALIAVVAVVIRRGRARRWRRADALFDALRPSRQTSAEKTAVSDGPEDDRAGDTRPDLSLPDGAWAGSAEDAEPDAAVDGDDGVGGSRWRPQTGVLVPAAAVILLACGVGMAVVVGGGSHGPAGRGSAASVDPVSAQSQTASVSAASSPQPGQHPAHGAHPAASPGPVKSASNGAAAAAGGPGSGSPGTSGTAGSGASGAGGGGASGAGGGGTSSPVTGPPSPGTLGGLPSSPVLCTGVSDTDYSCSFTFTAEGGPVNYTVSEPASEDPDVVMTITNFSGTLQAGSTAAIMVTITPEGLGSSQSATAPYVTVNPGGATVSFGISLPCVFCG